MAKTKPKKEPMAEELLIDANRQRIELGGQPGTGKTYALFALAEMIMVEDPEAHIYALDFDRGMGKVLPEWPGIDNITFYPGRKWEDVMDFVEKVQPLQGPRDWIFLDMIGKAWELAQNFEISMVHDNTAGKLLLEARKKMVEDNHMQAPGQFPTPDWTVIKRLHNDEFIDAITDRWDAHVVATTSLDPLDDRFDDQLLTSVFQEFGYKLDGEKRNVHRFDTIMFVERRGPRIFIHTLKDRGRPTIKDVEVKGRSLWEDYEAALKKKGYSWIPDTLV